MAAGRTYTPIATQTLSTTAATITFSSIPSSYTDLVLVFTGQSTSGNIVNYLQFNSDTATNYSWTALGGSGGAAVSARGTSVSQPRIDYYGYMDQTEANRIVHIMNYTNTTTYKTFISRANNSNNGVSTVAGLWRSTAAITSITVGAGGTFTSGSTFTLYGIAAA